MKTNLIFPFVILYYVNNIIRTGRLNESNPPVKFSYDTRSVLKISLFGLIALFVLTVSVPSAFAQSTESETDSPIKMVLDLTRGNLLDSFDDTGEIPSSAQTFYDLGQEEYQKAIDALNAGDFETAEEHALIAMTLFEDSASVIGEIIESESFEDSSGIDEFNSQIINQPSSANIFEIQEKITDTDEEVENLRQLIESNNLDVNLDEYEKSINLAKEGLADGDISGANEKLSIANEMKNEVYNQINVAVEENQDERIEQFVTNSISTINEMLANGEELGLSQETLNELQDTLDVLNTGEIDEILEKTDDNSNLAKELKEENKEAEKELKEENKEAEKELKEENKEAEKELKEENKEAEKELKEENKEAEKELKEENKEAEKELKEENKEVLEKLKEANDEAVEKLKETDPDAAKELEKENKEAEKALEDAIKESEKELKEENKEAEKALDEAEKALKEENKEAEKALKEENKEAEKALKEENKEAEKALKEDEDNSNTGEIDDNDGTPEFNDGEDEINQDVMEEALTEEEITIEEIESFSAENDFGSVSDSFYADTDFNYTPDDSFEDAIEETTDDKFEEKFDKLSKEEKKAQKEIKKEQKEAEKLAKKIAKADEKAAKKAPGLFDKKSDDNTGIINEKFKVDGFEGNGLDGKKLKDDTIIVSINPNAGTTGTPAAGTGKKFDWTPDGIGTWTITASAVGLDSIKRIVTITALVPDEVDKLDASVDSSSQITVDWKVPKKLNGATITGYKVERETSVGSDIWLDLSLVPETYDGVSLIYVDTGLDPDTEYNYRVSALSDNGQGATDTVKETTDPLNNVPDKVDGLKAKADSDTQITVDWKVPKNLNGATITGYKVERETIVDSGVWFDLSLVPETYDGVSLIYVDTLLVADTEYNYRVSALSDNGQGVKDTVKEKTKK